MRKLIIITLLILCFAHNTNAKSIVDKTMKNTTIIEAITQMSYVKQKQIICLALNIYHEARGSTENDMWAVGYVTLNRKNSSKYPNNICKVVFQYKKIKRKKIAQFSWIFGSDKQLIPKDNHMWDISQKMAYILFIDPGMIDITNDSMYFYAPKKVHPKWAYNPTTYRQIGSHIYLSLK